MFKKKLFVDEKGKLHGADNRRFKNKFKTYIQVYVEVQEPDGRTATHCYNPLPNTTEALGFISGLALDLFRNFPHMNSLTFFVVDSDVHLRAQLRYINPTTIQS